jgi:hypothetical protein
VTTSSHLRFDIEDAPAGADIEVLPNALESFNESRWPGHRPWRPLAVFARDRESIVVGLAGEAYSGWLFIRLLPQARLRGVRRTGHHARAKGDESKDQVRNRRYGERRATGREQTFAFANAPTTASTGRDAGSALVSQPLFASSHPNIRAH